MMLLKLTLKQILRQRFWSILFIVNLTLSLAALLTVDRFKTSLQAQLSANSKALLAGDLALTTRRELSNDELTAANQVLSDSTSSIGYDFFAMIRYQNDSRLVLVKAIDQNYPLYGELLDQNNQSLPSQFSELGKMNLWAYPELKDQLQVDLGDELELGNLKLKVSAFIGKDETLTFRAASIAPRVFIDRSLLKQSGLIQFGSTFSQTVFYKIPPNEKRTEIALRDLIYEKVKDPNVQVITSQAASEDSGRQFGYLSEYMGLLGMVSFLLSLISAHFLLRANILQNLKQYGIFKALGLTSQQIYQVELQRIAALGLAASLFAIPFSFLLSDLLPLFLKDLMSIDLSLQFSIKNFLLLLFLSPGILILFQYPQLSFLSRINPAQLFQAALDFPSSQKRDWFKWGPAILSIIAVNFWISKSVQTTAVFLGALISAALLLRILGWGLTKLFVILSPKKWFYRFGLLHTQRLPQGFQVLMLTMGLGTILLALPMQLQRSVTNELVVNPSQKTPSLFLFDIQDEQLLDLQAKIKEQGADTLSMSPMIRARIKTVNGVEFERTLNKSSNDLLQTREAEAEARFRNRGVNLSYRPSLSKSESIVAGKDFSGPFNPDNSTEVELSIEKRYADRIGLKLNDQIEFDIQGVAIKGKVINFRRVQWTSFSPNFFILVQPGALDLAPKTWITGLNLSGAEQIKNLTLSLSKSFRNVSIVDLRRTVVEVLKISNKMTSALQLMAALCLMTGLIILVSLAQMQMAQRRQEFNLIKILGAKQSEMIKYTLGPLILVTIFSAGGGVLLSLLVSSGLLLYIFDIYATADLSIALTAGLITLSLGQLAIWLFVVRIFRTKVSEIFQEV